MPYLVDYPVPSHQKVRPSAFPDFVIRADGKAQHAGVNNGVFPTMVLEGGEIYVRFERQGVVTMYLTMSSVTMEALDTLERAMTRLHDALVIDETYYSFVEEKFAVRTATAHDFNGLIERINELRMLRAAYMRRAAEIQVQSA